MAEPVIYLPSTEHLPRAKCLWVRPKPELPVGDLLSFTEADARRIPQVIANGIAEWNLCDDAGKPLEISGETLGRLPSTDIWHIGGELYRATDDADFEQAVILAIAGSGDKVPWGYLAYRYRRLFNVSWPDFAATPLKVIQRDIMIYNLEAQYQQSQHEEQENG